MQKDIWMSKKWMNNKAICCSERRTGLYMRYDKEVDSEVKIAFKDLARWIRARFYFPVRVTVYVKASKRVLARDGDLCVSVFFRPDSYEEEPYSRIATGDYKELADKWDDQKAKIALLTPLFIDLTYYFQWLNAEKLTLIGEKRQASCYANALMEEYWNTTHSWSPDNIELAE